jgi:hypothetical protein
MSIGDGVRVPSGGAPAGVRAGPSRRRTPASASPPKSIAQRVGVSSWTGYAWGAIAVTSCFVALTCWWLTQDRSIPIYDAGAHLETAFQYRAMLEAGNFLGLFNYESVYPPLVHIIGGLAGVIGGVNVAAPIVAENLIFVPLLAFGCYRTGRLLFGSAAGLLAVACVLGAPLLIEQFHVFMLDAPMTALIAVTIWLVLASEDFSRFNFAAAAGFAAGFGMLTKVQFAVYVAGFVCFVLLHGGWRNWRGVLVFLGIGFVIAAPWYIIHLSEFSRIFEIAGTSPGADVPPGNAPPTLTVTNFLWYFWSVMNSQLLVPLFLLAIGGSLWMFATLVRNREGQGARLELLVGAFLTWLTITITPHHDIRYGMPLLAYTAVIATGWIVCLPRYARLAATTVLIVGVMANTLGVTVGVGREASLALASSPPSTQQIPDQMIFYARKGFLAAGPIRDGDMQGLFEVMRRNGVRTVAWSLEQSRLPDFSFEGLIPLAQIAGLSPALTSTVEFSPSPLVATLIHEPIGSQIKLPPCRRLVDGTGVWVVRYDSNARKLALYCPGRNPQYYGVGRIR